jgi:RimJ/RimL family protein N-acetyltransferase
MKTELEKNRFEEIWIRYLELIKSVAFEELKFHKLFTYAFDIRPHLYPALEKAGLKEEARLKNHVFFDNNWKDVIIHSIFQND